MNHDEYKYNFKKSDAVKWLTNSIKMRTSIYNTIKCETKDEEEFTAAFSFFCRAYNLDLKGK